MTSSLAAFERHQPGQVSYESQPITKREERRLARIMHTMFGLRVIDCLGHVPTDTPLDLNFEYPDWLK